MGISSYSAKTVWNMDEARLKVINEIMVAFNISITAKDIKNTDAFGRQLWRDVCSILLDTKFEEIKKKIEEWEKIKRKINPDLTETEHNLALLEYFSKASEIYIELNKAMADSGLYFRFGKDKSRAVLEND